MNRIDRLSAILIQLQSRKTVRAQDIAGRFQISLRTVYRDIRSLEEAGIPIIGEAGIGYSLVEGYRLPPVMFTREEAVSFITAEKLVASLTDTANGNTFSLAVDKIRAVLKTADKDYMEHMDDKIEVIRSHRIPEINQGTPLIDINQNPLQLILQAISARQVMQLNYFAYYRQEHTSRKIEPLGVFYLDHYWHLIGWCRERKAYRDFRFDRIVDISCIEEQFVGIHPSLKNYMHEQYKEIKLEEITVLVDAEASLHLGEQKYYHGYLSQTQSEAGVEMQFLSTSLEGFARWYMTFADYARILQPPSLQLRVKSLFNDIAKKMKVL